MKKNTKSKQTTKQAPKEMPEQNDSADEAKKSRISVVQSDPIFHEMPKREKKVKVDSRFKAMFDDERFASTTSAVDRHGRPVNKLKSREDLRNLYELEESDENDEDNKQKDARFLAEKLDTKKKLDFARGEGNLSSSSDEEQSDDESIDDVEEDDGLNLHNKWGELDHDVKRAEWISRRLAVCNLDWEKMSAEDIFISLESFKPENGIIKSVHVYLSDFGAEQLKYEEEHGPRLPNVKKSKTAKNEEESDDDTGEAKPEVLRAYQFDRFRFYYAVVECDSDETANELYKSCDGVQYQSSGLTLDLRFIPDEMDFDATRLRDYCTPDTINTRKYKPKYFESAATRSNVKLDWDKGDYHRETKVKKAFDEDANLEEFSGLIASGSDSEEDNRDAKNLLLSAASIDVRADKGRYREAEDDYVPIDSDGEQEEKVRKPEKKKNKLKMKLVEKKKRKLADLATNLPADLQDSRFDSLYTSAEFAIDKTNPNYKGGVIADHQVKEKIRRKN